MVHPRVCGENGLLHLLEDLVAGSSPRVRGKLVQDFEENNVYRFIPACAGKTG